MDSGGTHTRSFSAAPSPISPVPPLTLPSPQLLPCFYYAGAVASLASVPEEQARGTGTGSGGAETLMSRDWGGSRSPRSRELQRHTGHWDDEGARDFSLSLSCPG